MGIGFTIDTPLKVSQYGIDSVISLVDDILLERLRKMYCGKYGINYDEITDKTEDYRAKRITSYLNIINELAEKKFEEVKNSISEKGNEIKDYFNMLPDSSTIKKEFKNFTDKYLHLDEVKNWLKENLSMGSIDVNIMTKVDKENYLNNEKLPVEFNDAHAALRGFANSNLSSSLILSAGMNPRLYSYIENFDDFYPDHNGKIKKKIVLKVSDYRSALIQGKFLAKKGLWVSEFRIESGLNCGGHAFATDGFLMGPILEEFKTKRNELIQSMDQIFKKAIVDKNRFVFQSELPLSITAQGGVGTAEEHSFLIDYFEVDSVGWGTPFLLVPEATNVDDYTLDLLTSAKEEDLYLSNISPLGVPFNCLKGNTKDVEKLALIEKGRPGSSCPKKYVELNNKEFTERSICLASRQYQHLKIKQIEKESISESDYNSKFEKIVEKSCICVGLGTSALLVNNLETKIEGKGVSVCPGPNIAYFSKRMSLKEMVDHIYGRINVIERGDRPNMFIKELNLYIDFLKNKVTELEDSFSANQHKYLLTFERNLNDGINYYNKLFSKMKNKFVRTKSEILRDLEKSSNALQQLKTKIENITRTAVSLK